jgi:hypothetical protein
MSISTGYEAPFLVWPVVLDVPAQSADDMSSEELALEWEREWEAAERRAGFRLVRGGLPNREPSAA